MFALEKKETMDPKLLSTAPKWSEKQLLEDLLQWKSAAWSHRLINTKGKASKAFSGL